MQGKSAGVASKTEMDIREILDVALIRRQLNYPHVCDEHALTALLDGREVFDVDPHCRRSDAFVDGNKLEADVWSEDLLPSADPDMEGRPVYFRRARWRKHNTTRPGGAA
jgi:hypothetical protein